MSRTYRKNNFWYSMWWFPEEETNAKHNQNRDGVAWEDTKYFFKQIHRVGRANAREQFSKLAKCEDIEDFSFDPSKHDKKRRGIWWEIY